MFSEMLRCQQCGGQVVFDDGGAVPRRLRCRLRKLEAGANFPNWETWDRICKLFGWPQTFVADV
jgi:hypothetical protein